MNLINSYTDFCAPLSGSVPSPNAGDRYADASDAATYPNVNIGDYIIEEVNANNEIRYDDVSNDDFITLGPGQKIHIMAGTYSFIRLGLDNCNGTLGNPVTITNLGGQVIADYIYMGGGEHLRLTGQYVPGVCGDVGFQGSFDNGNPKAGTYGFLFDGRFDPVNTGIAGVYTSDVAFPSTFGRCNNTEVDHIEVRGGHFAGIMCKEDDPADFTTDANINIHDCYIHDTDSEGLYLGNTSQSPQHRVIATVRNNVIVRCGGEAFQLANGGDGSIIENNVFWGAIGWKTAFQEFVQDGCIQISLREGNTTFQNNMCLSGGNKTLFVAQVDNFGGAADSGTGTCTIQNNYMGATRTQALVVNNFPDKGITVVIDDNDWGPSDNPSYLETYTDIDQACYHLQLFTSGVEVEYTNNRHATVEVGSIPDCNNLGVNETVRLVFSEFGANLTYTNNTAGDTIPVPDFVGDGFSYTDLADYLLIEVYSQLDLRSQPITYNVGDWVRDGDKFYTKINTAGNVPPTGVTDANWQLEFSGGWPTDDWRLDGLDFHNKVKSRGLTYNLVDNSITYLPASSSASAPTYRVELPTGNGNAPVLGAIDNGDNTITFKYGRDDQTLTAPTVVGWGSSTMFGSHGGVAANSYLKDLMEDWVENTLGGQWYNISQNGYTSRRFLEDTDPDTTVDRNRNIDTVLALNPDIVVLNLPSNDQDSGDAIATTNAEFLQNLVSFDSYMRSQGVTMFVTTTQPRNNFSQTDQQRLLDVAALIRAEFADRCVDTMEELRDQGSIARVKAQYDAGDEIHVNTAGHAYIFSEVQGRIQNWFQDQNYVKYVLESSASPDTGYTILQDNIDPESVELTLPRVTSDTRYYRLRAQNQDLSFTVYSEPVELTQPVFIGAVDQTIKINFTGAALGPASGEWNNWYPTDDVANAGETLPLNDITGSPASVNATVVGEFRDVNLTNGPAGDPTFNLPLEVSRGMWQWDSTSLTQLPVLVIDGLQTDQAYDISAYSRNTNDNNNADRITAISSARKQSFHWTGAGFVGSTLPNIKSQINAVVPESDGTVFISFKAIGASGKLAELVLERRSNDNSIPYTPASSTGDGANHVPSADEGPKEVGTGTWREPSQQYWYYTPPGYNDAINASRNYPCLIYLHGAGSAGQDVNVIRNRGPFRYINDTPGQGDEPADIIIISPQHFTNTSWLFTSVLNEIYDEITTRFRIDTNRMYGTGFSLGAAGVLNIHGLGINWDPPAVVPYAGSIIFGDTNNLDNLAASCAVLVVHGTADANAATPPLTPSAVLDLIQPRTPKYPPEALLATGIGHSETGLPGYNRLNRTDGGGTATYDYIDWLMKHSLDSNQEITLFVEYAEKTNRISDVNIAQARVDTLSAGSQKDTLQSRLNAIRSSLAVRQVIINVGDSYSGNNVNPANTVTSGTAYSNLVDEYGNTTQYGFTVVTQTASGGAKFTGDNRLSNTYQGLDEQVYNSGARVQNAGTYRFTNLDPTKTYNIIVIPIAYATNYTFVSEVRITVDGVTKEFEDPKISPELNTFFAIRFDDEAPDGSNNIDIGIDSVSSAECTVCAIILEERDFSPGVIPYVPASSTGDGSLSFVSGSTVNYNPATSTGDGTTYNVVTPVAQSVIVNFGSDNTGGNVFGTATPPTTLPAGYVSVGWDNTPNSSPGETNVTTVEMTYYDNAGNSINDLLDGDGSGWKIRSLNDGFRQNWGWFNGSGGDLGEETDGAYDGDAIRHCWYTGNNTTPYYAEFEIYNLNPNSDYTLTFLGSWDGSGSRTCTWTADSQTTATLDATNNTNNTVSLSGVTSNGSGVILVRCTVVSGFGYMNVMEITEE